LKTIVKVLVLTVFNILAFIVMKKKFLTGIKEIYEPDPTKVLGLDAYNDQEMKNVDKEVDNTESGMVQEDWR
jgi:hypothetical protein